MSFDSTVEILCQRYGNSKPDYYSRCSCDTICSCSFTFNITFLNADLCQRQYNKPRDKKFALMRGKTEWFRLACLMACLRILSCRYTDISLEAFLLREFRTSGYNSERFVFICFTKHLQGLYKRDLNTSHRSPLRSFLLDGLSRKITKFNFESLH